MISPEDISRIVNKIIDLVFSQSITVILLLVISGYLGYLLVESENRNEVLQERLVISLQENQIIQKECLEARLQEYKDNQQKRAQ